MVKVIVIGGGPGGVRVCLNLQDKFDVTLVEPRDAFYFVIGFPRALVEPGFGQRLLWPYGELFQGGRTKVVRQRAESINAATNELTLADGTVLPFDFAVIAVGSQNRAALKSDALLERIAVLAAIEALAARVRVARRVVVIGGGAVGLESAGEIASAQPNTKVILVHRGKRPLEHAKSLPGVPTFSDKFFAQLDETLKQLPNLTIRLNESVVDAEAAVGNNDKRSVSLASGAVIADVDVVLWATGPDIENPIIAPFAHTKQGLVVNAHMQLESHSNIFAVGDIVDTHEAKMSAYANQHGELVASNIELLATSGTAAPAAALKSRQPQTVAGIMLPLGRTLGIASFGGNVMDSAAVASMKGADYFVARARGAFGLK